MARHCGAGCHVPRIAPLISGRLQGKVTGLGCAQLLPD
jgi:hypothetical protein